MAHRNESSSYWLVSKNQSVKFYEILTLDMLVVVFDIQHLKSLLEIYAIAQSGCSSDSSEKELVQIQSLDRSSA